MSLVTCVTCRSCGKPPTIDCRVHYVEELAAERNKVKALEASLEALELAGSAERWTDEDRTLPEDEAIDAAFPTRSGNHDAYAEAMRLVGARRSKFGLVALVCWLLVQIDDLKRRKA